jgi:hypothetical protein
MRLSMNYGYLPRLAFAAGLAICGVCAFAADTRAASPAAVVRQLMVNASKTAPAKILVFIVKDKSAPVSRDVATGGTP